MLGQIHTPGPRIAVIWENESMPSREAYHALCRFNERGTRAMLQRFGLEPSLTRPRWIQSIRDWRPDGLLVQTEKWDRLKKLRRALPGVPFVSGAIAPPGLVDACVVSDVAEIMEQARNHFISRGVTHLGLYCCADNEPAIHSRTTAFRKAMTNGFELIYARGDRPGGRKPIYQWLESLPKPVGIVAAEMIGGPFLLGCCKDLGIKVPAEVQIIGVDDVDECLAQIPHLTSIELPSKRMGVALMETLLGLMGKPLPAASSVVYVPGCKLVVRDSTALLRAGKPVANTVSEIIREHGSDDLPVERMARLAGVGRTTFYKEFKKATGKSPASHLREMRLLKACDMLRDTSAPLKDIAKTCGFKSLIYFAQFFRRETGQTPTEYRKNSK